MIGAIIDIKCPHADVPEAYYLTHLTKWNINRVKGIVGGINGCRGGKLLKILNIKIDGIELQFKLEVCK